MPTLRDLMALPGLDLELLHGDPATRWSGVRRVDDPGEADGPGQGELRLAEASWTPPRGPDPRLERGPAALVLAATPRVRAAPARLRSRAEAAGVPLLLAPPSVGPERVRDAALRLLSGELVASGAAAGAAALQRFALGALASPKPERELLERLHRLTGASFALLAPWGEARARSGPRGARSLPPRAHELPEGAFRAAGAPALLRRVRVDGRERGTLVVLDADATAEAALPLALAVLELLARRRDAEAERDRAERAALLSAWLSGSEAPDALSARLRAAGLEPEAGVVLLAVETGVREARGSARGAGRAGAARRARALALAAGDELFEAAGVPALSTDRGSHALFAVSGAGAGARAGALRAAVEAATGGPARVGVAPPHPGPAHPGAPGLERAERRALLALAAVEGPSGEAGHDDLDPVAWWMARQPDGALDALRGALLGPLEEADASGKLRRTLRAWMRIPDDARALAAELHVHPNTLRYRLDRIESLLGASLRDPATAARLYLAMRAEEAGGREGG